MKKYWECHITMRGDSEVIKPVVENILKWKYSAIDGDIMLGDGVKCYATMHYSIRQSEKNVIEKVNDCVQVLCQVQYGEFIKVLRKKVEKVVYDAKVVYNKKGTTKIGNL